MDKDHLPLLEDQNPVRRSEIFAGTGSAKVALTEAIKSLSNVSGREADICVLGQHKRESESNFVLNERTCHLSGLRGTPVCEQLYTIHIT